VVLPRTELCRTAALLSSALQSCIAVGVLYRGLACSRLLEQYEFTDQNVWTGAENLALTGFRSPDRPARRQSLYRLSYPVQSPNCSLYQNSVHDNHSFNPDLCHNFANFGAGYADKPGDLT
jgi:hypothetical protein